MNSDNQVAQLQKRIKELEDQNRILQEKVDYLTHKLFGSSSEQTSSLGIEGQMSIFDEAEVSADPKAAEPDMKVASYRRLKFKGQREELLSLEVHSWSTQNSWKTTCLGIHSYNKYADSHFPNYIWKMAILKYTIFFDAYVHIVVYGNFLHVLSIWSCLNFLLVLVHIWRLLQPYSL